VVDFPSVYHSLLGWPCFAKFMVVTNYTYLNVKMPGPNGVITVEGNFEQAYYCEQDRITQAAALSTPCGPTGSGCDIGRAPSKEGTKAMAMLGPSSIGEALETPGGSVGLAGPSIQALSSLEGADSIEVSSNLSP
jgi:hypothetical protein